MEYIYCVFTLCMGEICFWRAMIGKSQFEWDWQKNICGMYKSNE